MTYALLIYRALAASTQASAEDGLAGHRALQAEASAGDELYAVAQLATPTTARSVRPCANGHEVTDGPFVESKEWLVGFYLLECESEEHAVARAKQVCTEGYAVEVRPVAWRWRQ